MSHRASYDLGLWDHLERTAPTRNQFKQCVTEHLLQIISILRAIHAHDYTLYCNISQDAYIKSHPRPLDVPPST